MAPANCQRERKVTGNTSRCLFADKIEVAEAWPGLPASEAFYYLYPNLRREDESEEAIESAA